MMFLYTGRNNLVIRLLSLVLITVLQCGCKKLVTVEPPITSITSESVYANDADAISVLTGIYTNMSSNSYRFVTGLNSISVKSGLSADELTLFGGTTNQNTELVRFYINGLKNSDAFPWQAFYSCILPVNTALEKLQVSKSLNPSIKQQLIGEAKFIRAFCYFYLASLYGEVPLALHSDYRATSVLARAPISTVYQQIVNDLKDAQNLLSDNYLDGSLLNNTDERVRPNKWAATALLSRTYLYLNDWINSEIEATKIISNNTFKLESDLNNVFLKTSAEAIWQLQPVIDGSNTEDAKVFILNVRPGRVKPVYLSTYLLGSFETGDNRRSSWVQDAVFSGVSYSYPTKYKIAATGLPVTEYLMVLRLAEQYLIRAEARAQQSRMNEALTDLNTIRERAGLSDTTISNKNTLLKAILNERQVELFTEWGHRWLDLKRTGNMDGIMSVVTPTKGGTWSTNWALYPISFTDIENDFNLTQNLGY